MKEVEVTHHMGNTSTETIINVKITKSAAEELVKTLVDKKETVASLTDPISVKHTAFLTEVITDVQSGLVNAAKAASPEAGSPERVAIKNTFTVTSTAVKIPSADRGASGDKYSFPGVTGVTESSGPKYG